MSTSGVAARPPLSRDRVLAAAIDVADAGGLASLSMRRLAQALNVEAMTLYYYVANKDDLLGGIVDMVVGGIELPSPGSDWKAALRSIAVSAHEVLLRHPWAAGLMLTPAGLGPARMRYMDAMLATLRGSGVSAGLAHHAYHALDSHILGFTLWVVGINAEAGKLRDVATTLLDETIATSYPYLAEHVRQHLEEDAVDRGAFEFGLDLVLDGLDRERAAEAHAREARARR